MQKRILNISLLFYIIISLILSYNIYAKDNDFLSIPKDFKIYFIKNSWHVGIIFPINKITESQLSILRNFKKYKYVDIGWGDAKFYQHSGTNYFLGAEALLYPTPSVVRVQGYLLGIKYFIKWGDFTVSINVNKTQLKSLLIFIKNSLSKTKSGKYIISSTKLDSDIIFYKSNLKYYLFKTCNTWDADDLRYAGFKVSNFGIITAYQLFKELIKIGKVEK